MSDYALCHGCAEFACVKEWRFKLQVPCGDDIIQWSKKHFPCKPAICPEHGQHCMEQSEKPGTMILLSMKVIKGAIAIN